MYSQTIEADSRRNHIFISSRQVEAILFYVSGKTFERDKHTKDGDVTIVVYAFYGEANKKRAEKSGRELHKGEA